MHRAACLLSAALTLAGCAAPDGLRPGPDCGAAGLQDLVGSDVTALDGLNRQGPTRILHPGDPVTEDFSPQRLNVFVDPQGRISRLSCG